MNVAEMLKGTIPNVYLSTVTLDTANASVKSTVTVLFQENTPGGIFTKWLNNEGGSAKYMKVVMIQTRTKADKEYVAEKAKEIIEQLSTTGGYEFNGEAKIDSRIDELTSSMMQETYSVGSDAVYELMRKYEFNLDLGHIEQLSYFIGIYFDIIQFFSDAKLPYDEAFGSGGVWTSAYDIIVDDVATEQHVVHDFRYLKKVQHGDNARDLTVFENQELHTTPHRINMSELEKKWSYVSEAWASHDEENRAKVIFAFDHMQMVLDNAQIGNLFMLNSGDNMRRYYPIRSFKLIRERVRETIGANKLGENIAGYVRYDIPGAPAGEVLCMTAQDGNGTLIPVNDGLVELEEQMVDALTPYRALAFVDKKMPKITDGLYRYMVEMSVDDGSKRYIADTYNMLSAMLTKMKGTLAEIDFKNMFDHDRNRLKLESLNIIGDDLNEYVLQVESAWMPAYGMLTGVYDKSLNAALRAMVQPNKATVFSLSTVIEFYSVYLDRLKRAVPDTFLDDTGGASQKVSGAANKVPQIRIRFALDYIHDANNVKFYGADHVTQEKSIPKLGKEQMIDRNMIEIDKYPVIEQPPLQIPPDADGERATMHFMYLTPIVIYLDEETGAETIPQYRAQRSVVDEHKAIKLRLNHKKLLGAEASGMLNAKDGSQKLGFSKGLLDAAATIDVVGVDVGAAEQKIDLKPVGDLLPALTPDLLEERLSSCALSEAIVAGFDGSKVPSNFMYDMVKDLGKAKGKKQIENETESGATDGNFFNGLYEYNIEYLRQYKPEKLTSRMPTEVKLKEKSLPIKKDKSEYLMKALPVQVRSVISANKSEDDGDVVREVGVDLLNLTYVEYLHVAKDIRTFEWKMLNDVQALPDDSSYLCRVQPLNLLPAATDEAKLPMYNKYFILET